MQGKLNVRNDVNWKCWRY